jgi:hypothetical protein
MLRNSLSSSTGPSDYPTSRSTQLKVFGISFLLYSLVLLPIVLADRYYLEDWRRLLRGSYGWTGEGRPFTDLLMSALNLGSPLMDISPLPQIAAITLLAQTSVLVSRKFAISPPLQAALAVFPLGASPFFLENLSFRFDSLPMSLSIVLALVPVLSLRSPGWATGIAGAVCIFSSLCFYQTGVNAFVVFLMVELSTLQLATVPFRTVAHLALHRVLQLVAGLIPYLLLARLIVHGGYNVEHFTYVTKLSDIGIVKNNWDTAWGKIFHSFPGTVRNILMFPIVLGILVMIVAGFSYFRRCSQSEQSRVGLLFIAAGIFILPVAWVAGSLGPVLLAVHALITLPRIYVGIGALLASAFVLICVAATKLRVSSKWIYLLLGVPAYLMLMLAAIYGNVLKEQGKYEDRIATRLSYDIQELARTYPVKKIILDGIVPYCPVVRQATQRYNIVRVSRNLYTDRLLREYTHHILEYHGINLPPELSDDRRSELLRRAAEVGPVIRNADYDIRRVEDALIVSFIDMENGKTK